jgi:hypothetical protein
MSSNTIEILYYVRDAAACLGVLVGLVGAVILFIRKKTFPGILALIGFFLLGVEPLLDVIIWRVISYNASANYDTLNSAYACGSGLAMFLGAVLVALAIILGFREPKLPPPMTEDEPPTELPPVQ